jgi:hypothetical protein
MKIPVKAIWRGLKLIAAVVTAVQALTKPKGDA